MLLVQLVGVLEGLLVSVLILLRDGVQQHHQHTEHDQPEVGERGWAIQEVPKEVRSEANRALHGARIVS